MQHIFEKYKPQHFPKLNDAGGDITKRWCVTYYLFDAKAQKPVRFRDRSMNVYKTERERRRYSEKLMAEYKEIMMQGYVVNLEKTEAMPSLLDAIKLVQNYKMETLTGDYARWFKTLGKFMEAYLSKIDKKDILITEVDKQFCFNFLDYQRTSRGISNKTYNNYMGVLSAVFGHFVDSGVLDKNPAEKMRLLWVRHGGRHRAYTQEQKAAILAALKAKGLHSSYLFVQFCYYTMARPYKEVRRLQIRDILADTIRISAQNSKTRLHRFCRIFKPLEAEIKAYNLRAYPPEYYSFGVDGPDVKHAGINYFYNKIMAVLTELGLEGNDYTIYSFKHSAAIALWEQTKDIRIVQAQCGHTRITQTETYLRDLELILEIDTPDVSF